MEYGKKETRGERQISYADESDRFLLSAPSRHRVTAWWKTMH